MPALTPKLLPLLLLGVATVLLAAARVDAATPPRVVGTSAVGDRVNLAFSAPIAPARPGAFLVLVNGALVKPRDVVVSGRRLQLVLPRAVYGDDVVEVAASKLSTRDRRRVRPFRRTVLNRSPTGCTLDTEEPLDTRLVLGSRRYSVLTVTVNFADAPGTRSQFRLDAVDAWVRDLSSGRASVDWTEHPGILRMPKLAADYAFSGDWSARRPFFEDVVRALDPGVDFSRHDAVFVAMTRPSWLGGASLVPIAPVGAGITADGRELRHFGWFMAEPPAAGLASLLHLAGLHQWGWQDVGEWQGALHMVIFRQLSLLGWDRRRLGWLGANQVRCVGSQPLQVTLSPLAVSGGVKLVVVPLTPKALLVLENRQRVGLDATQCKSGILVYEVRPDTDYRRRVLPAETRSTAECPQLGFAPYDLRPGGSATVAGVTFEVLEILPDGSYRLRVRA